MKNLLRFSPHRKPIHPRVRHSINEDTRDRPLYLGWQPKDPEAFTLLKLPKPRNKTTQLAQTQIIGAALVTGREDPERWVSYSRAKTFYEGVKARYGETYTYQLVVPSIDILAREGWIDNERMPPGPRGFQSRLRATDQLLAALGDVELIYAPKEALILHRDLGLANYRDTPETRQMRQDIAAINEAVGAQRIELRDFAFHEGVRLRNGMANIGAIRLTQYRQFQRGTMDCGGRFYGGSWQNLPGETEIENGIETIGRNEIRINGEPTVERDYEALHIRLLYMKAADPMPPGDPYDLGTWPRKWVKFAMLIAINAKTEFEAEHALAKQLVELAGGEMAERLSEAKRLLRDCAAKHKPIAQFFGSDAGVRLMREDSDLANAVMLAMLREGIAPLGVHDSFIVPQANGPKLEEVMQAELAKHDTKRALMAPNKGFKQWHQRDNLNLPYIGVWGDWEMGWLRKRERTDPDFGVGLVAGLVGLPG
jgi:hypothetical protein